MARASATAAFCLFALGGSAGCLLAGEPPDPTPQVPPANLTGQESTPAETGKTRSFNSIYSHRPSDPPKSRRDNFSEEEWKKTTELDRPVTVEILSTGRKIEGLAEAAERLVDVRITNPNPYGIFFFGRQYGENKTVTLTWNTWKDGHWVRAGRDWCGTGVRDWDIPAGGSIDVLLSLSPNLGPRQQLLSTFYRADKPSVQSDCLLYEHQ